MVTADTTAKDMVTDKFAMVIITKVILQSSCLVDGFGCCMHYLAVRSSFWRNGNLLITI